MGNWDKGRLSDSPSFHPQSIAKSINENETCKSLKVTSSRVHWAHNLQLWRWLQEYGWRWKIRKGDYCVKEGAGSAFQEKEEQHRPGKMWQTHLSYLGITWGWGGGVITSGLLDLTPVKVPFDSLEAYCIHRTTKVKRDACICQNSLL